jgi:signal transduction histidine kinase
MVAGSVLSFWQFRNISRSASRLSNVEQRVTSLLRLNNNLLTLMGHLHRSAEPRDPLLFETEAWRLLNEFQKETADADRTIQEISGESARNAAGMAGIRGMLGSLTGRVSSLVQLAREQDWTALNARLLNQSDHTDDVVAVLITQVDADLGNARRLLVEDLAGAQSRAAQTLVIATVLSLATAGLLGAWITRSITRPLSTLGRGARALAAGDFQHRVPIDGTDELAHVTQVFNSTAAELAGMFDEVQTQRAAAEAAQAALEERARELGRANADLQQFAYSASHDLQEPLRIVALYSQLLQRRYAGQLDERADEYIEYLYRAAHQMAQLVTDLLTYTRTTSIAKEEPAFSNVPLVLQRVLSTFEKQIASQQCRVTAGQLPCVSAHEVHVQQLLQNLIGNALKYRSEHTPEISIEAERKGGCWEFAVRDNGIGIDPQYANQIFGIFKRLHGQKYPGTGIGLAICQRIVEGYGGTIWVESELGEGATFRFTLPAG